MAQLANIEAKRLVADWVTACRSIAAKSNSAPFISLSHAGERYLIILQQMIADKLEQILDEANRNP